METGIHALTAGYALDALDPDERRAFEEHLEGCERCQEELESFWETGESLAVAASGPVPGPELRDRVLAAARAEPQVVVPLVVPLEPRRSRAVPALAAVAAVAAVVAIGVGILAIALSNDLDESRIALERQREASALLADPSSRDVALESGQGRLVVGQDGRAVLVLAGLDPAPEGKTYVAWIVEGETPLAAGAFPGSDATDVVGPLDGSVDAGDFVAVTVEEGVVEAPTTPLIVKSTPA
jgi:anti-sigma factor RsiW